MITVTKEFSWDMAHMLEEHPGLCKNLHGHTYKAQVTVARVNEEVIPNQPNGRPYGDTGMVVDFKELKEVVNKIMVSKLDHAFVTHTNTVDNVELTIATVLRAQGRKVVELPFRTTAENMAKYFGEKLAEHFMEQMTTPLQLISLKLWETPTSFAMYMPEEI